MGRREEGRKGGRDEGRKGGRKGGREEGRKGGREEGRKGRRDEGTKGGREEEKKRITTGNTLKEINRVGLWYSSYLSRLETSLYAMGDGVEEEVPLLYD